TGTRSLARARSSPRDALTTVISGGAARPGHGPGLERVARTALQTQPPANAGQPPGGARWACPASQSPGLTHRQRGSGAGDGHSEGGFGVLGAQVVTM